MKYDKYRHRYIYTIVLIAFVLFCVLVQCTVVRAQTSIWENNPYNFKNNELNYANTSYDYSNSQYNWENNEFNVTARNGMYDNSGDRIGYETVNRYGTRNFYDDYGNRIAYGK